MGGFGMSNLNLGSLPAWLPVEIEHYLQHTLLGISIRKLAKQAGCHPSTILRQVRRIEDRREDILVDGGLKAITTRNLGRVHIEHNGTLSYQAQKHQGVECSKFNADALRIMTVLAAPGAVLAVVEGMDRAVIVRESVSAGQARDDKIAVDVFLAQCLALRGWIRLRSDGRVKQYVITPEGRSNLTKLVAEREEKARMRAQSVTQSGLNELLAVSDTQTAAPISARARYGLQETPLQQLARLTDNNGNTFLGPEMIQAGERLREDFELAQIRDVDLSDRSDADKDISNAAARRVTETIAALGPGLSDIAVRCCCHLEGLAAAEKDLGWSARSGKVVLRIALQQLHGYYASRPENISMIG